MCGIVGIASRDVVADRTWLSVGSDAISHRGPDDVGEWWSSDGRVGIAHRRLSIIDVSTAGHQPMQDFRRGITVGFNGEIYNYRDLRAELTAKGQAFRSQSDTEVLLAAYCEWDTDCLSHLNGMFAFALYDCDKTDSFLRVTEQARSLCSTPSLMEPLGSHQNLRA